MKLRILLVPVLAVFSLVVASCADDDASGTSGSNGSDTTEATSGEASDETEATGDGSAEETDAAADTTEWPPMGSPVSLDSTSELNLAEIAAGVTETQTLTRLVLQAGLLPTIRDGGPFTVFAPVEDAFAAVDPDALRSIAHDKEQLTRVLTLHVVPGEFTSEDLIAMEGSTLTTVEGGELRIEVDGDEVTVGGALVAVPDIRATNGVIHAVDTVITAPNG